MGLGYEIMAALGKRAILPIMLSASLLAATYQPDIEPKPITVPNTRSELTDIVVEESNIPDISPVIVEPDVVSQDIKYRPQ